MTKEQKARKRSQVPVEDTWDLSRIFPSEEDWAKEYEALGTMVPELAAYQGTLGTDAAALLDWFRRNDDLTVRLQALYGYASCCSDSDTANAHYVDLKSKAARTVVALDAACAFAAPEIIAIPEERLQQFLAQMPELAEYRRALETIRRTKDHVLSPAEEALLASAGEVIAAPSEIAATLRDADLTFPEVIDSAGVSHGLTDSTFIPLLESSDVTLRRNTFRGYYKVYEGVSNTCAAALDGQFKQLCFQARVRRYSSTLEAALFDREVPTEVYHNLIDTVHAHLPSLHRYVTLRKRMLGLDELHMYDIYTPIVADAAAEFTFSQARDMVLEALSVLGSDYTALLQKGFEDRWIDKYENRGKRSGAYSTDFSRPHPFVLLNFTGNLDSVFTLAHEMGHALHSYLSTAAQPVSTSDYVIFVAEVASTVNEVLLMRHLLGKTTDPRRKAYLINHFLDQFKGTLFRQTQFAEFERMMGVMAECGEALTAPTLSEKYRSLNEQYYGPEMISDPEIALEWARIPHFYYDYYVFQYATGFSAAVAIADRILTLGAPAVADYKCFLSGGNSRTPIELLKIAGVDMSTPAPVESALSFFDSLITQLDKLRDQL